MSDKLRKEIPQTDQKSTDDESSKDNTIITKQKAKRAIESFVKELSFVMYNDYGLNNSNNRFESIIHDQDAHPDAHQVIKKCAWDYATSHEIYLTHFDKSKIFYASKEFDKSIDEAIAGIEKKNVNGFEFAANGIRKTISFSVNKYIASSKYRDLRKNEQARVLNWIEKFDKYGCNEAVDACLGWVRTTVNNTSKKPKPPKTEHEWKNSNNDWCALALKALKQGYHQLFELLCVKKAEYINFNVVLEAIMINDSLFKAGLIGYMKKKEINDLKMFNELVDWASLKKVGIKKSELLRDIDEYGIKKRNWIYITSVLCYNLDKAIVNAKKLPNLLIKTGAVNQDKENSKREMDYGHKNAPRVNEWYVGKILGNDVNSGTFGEIVFNKAQMGVDGKGKRVALKFIDLGDKANNGTKSKRKKSISSIAEAISNIRKINHKNVIQLLAFNLNLNLDNKIMLVFEYAIYGELYQYIIYCKNRCVNFKIAKHILKQILSGLEYCHSLGIIHRNINPHNILLTRKYTSQDKEEFEIVVKVSDFELNAPTKIHEYSSPEMLKSVDNSHRDVDYKCDIFSLGVILWQMVYGTDLLPFDEATENDSKYGYIMTNKPQVFWKLHEQMLIQTIKSQVGEMIKLLFCQLFQFDPYERITIANIYNHKWYRMVPDMSGREFTKAMKPYTICHQVKRKSRKSIKDNADVVTKADSDSKIDDTDFGHYDAITDDDIQNEINDFVAAVKTNGSFTVTQICMLHDMKYAVEYKMNYKDETMNLFKLILYQWDLNQAIKYYNNDCFCHDYCISTHNDKYTENGCRNEDNNCAFGKHSMTLSSHIVFSQQANTKTNGKWFINQSLCLYLLYLKEYKNKNANKKLARLFLFYARLLQLQNKYLKAEKFYKQAIHADIQLYEAHHDYALLLDKLLQKDDKAELHYGISLKNNPNIGKYNRDYASFLLNRNEYQTSLKYCDKACELEQADIKAHFLKSVALFRVNKYDKSVDESVITLQLVRDKVQTDEIIDLSQNLIEIGMKEYNEREKNYNINYKQLLQWLCHNNNIRWRFMINETTKSILLETIHKCLSHLCGELNENNNSEEKVKIKATEEENADVAMEIGLKLICGGRKQFEHESTLTDTDVVQSDQIQEKKIEFQNEAGVIEHCVKIIETTDGQIIVSTEVNTCINKDDDVNNDASVEGKDDENYNSDDNNDSDDNADDNNQRQELRMSNLSSSLNNDNDSDIDENTVENKQGLRIRTDFVSDGITYVGLGQIDIDNDNDEIVTLTRSPLSDRDDEKNRFNDGYIQNALFRTSPMSTLRSNESINGIVTEIKIEDGHNGENDGINTTLLSARVSSPHPKSMMQRPPLDTRVNSGSNVSNYSNLSSLSLMSMMSNVSNSTSDENENEQEQQPQEQQSDADKVSIVIKLNTMENCLLFWYNNQFIATAHAAVDMNYNNDPLSDDEITQVKQQIKKCVKHLYNFEDIDTDSSNTNMILWLYDNQLSSIKDKILTNKKSFQVLKECGADYDSSQKNIGLAHFWKSKIFYHLGRFDESIDQGILALKLPKLKVNDDNQLSKKQLNQVKDVIYKCLEKMYNLNHHTSKDKNNSDYSVMLQKYKKVLKASKSNSIKLTHFWRSRIFHDLKKFRKATDESMDALDELVVGSQEDLDVKNDTSENVEQKINELTQRIIVCIETRYHLKDELKSEMVQWLCDNRLLSIGREILIDKDTRKMLQKRFKKNINTNVNLAYFWRSKLSFRNDQFKKSIGECMLSLPTNSNKYNRKHKALTEKQIRDSYRRIIICVDKSHSSSNLPNLKCNSNMVRWLQNNELLYVGGKIVTNERSLQLLKDYAWEYAAPNTNNSNIRDSYSSIITHMWKSKILESLGVEYFDESIDACIDCLKLNEKSGGKKGLSDKQINQLRQQIEMCVNKKYKLDNECNSNMVRWLYDNDLAHLKNQIFDHENKDSFALLRKCASNYTSGNKIHLTHFWKSKILYHANCFEESIEQAILARKTKTQTKTKGKLKTNTNRNGLSNKRMDEMKDLIEMCVEKLYKNKKKFECRDKTYETALAAGDSIGLTHLCKSRILYQLGRFDEATQACVNSFKLELNSTNNISGDYIEKLKRHTKKCIAKLKASKEFKEFNVNDSMIKWLYYNKLSSMLGDIIKNEAAREELRNSTWEYAIGTFQNNMNSVTHTHFCKSKIFYHLQQFEDSITEAISGLEHSKFENDKNLITDTVESSLSEYISCHKDWHSKDSEQEKVLGWSDQLQKHGCKGPVNEWLGEAVDFPYSAVVKASTKGKVIFEQAVKTHIASSNYKNFENATTKNTFGKLTKSKMKPFVNSNNRTPAQEALKQKYYQLFELLCKKMQRYIGFNVVLEAIMINDSLFKVALVAFMRNNEINDLKKFNKKIKWGTFKKKGLRKSALLRDIDEYGIKKKNWVYISIRLDYNLDDAIAHAKKIPNLLIKLNVKNEDKEDLELEKKHWNKKTLKVDDWYVGKILGAGAFGQVKLGINNKGKRVALKFIDIDEIVSGKQWPNKNKKQKGNEEKRNRLITFIAGEISNIQKINHENIIQLLAFNLNVDNKIMLVFEYAIYGELYQVINNGKNKCVNFRMAKYILNQILSALKACHSLGIIHRDIKPQNILVTQKYNNSNNSNSSSIILKVADFGLSAVTESLANSKQLVYVGTRGYMSPEIAAPWQPDSQDLFYDPHTVFSSGSCDIFSTGVILWQMVYGIGSLPFDEARANDSKYHYIFDNHLELFWKCHPNVKQLHTKMREKNKVQVDAIRSLFWRLFAPDPTKRITIDEIKNHLWYTTVADMSPQDFTAQMTPYVENLNVNDKNNNIQDNSNSLQPPVDHYSSSWMSQSQLNSMVPSGSLTRTLLSPRVYATVMPYSMTNPLIVMMGISIYEDGTQLPTLEGVYNDYYNVKHVLNYQRGFSMVYFNKNDKLIYVNKQIKHEKDVDDKFKLKWTSDDIETFNKQIKTDILEKENNKYNHDSLIYIISGHGNRDECIYDSNGQEYSLHFLYYEYNNKNCKLLREKPKVFIIDADRGDIRTKMQQQHRASLSQSKSIATKLSDNYTDDSDADNDDANGNNEFKDTIEAHKTFVEGEHFRMIFCNTRESKSPDGGTNGGYLIQSFTEALSNDRIFYHNTFSSLKIEIRRIMAQLMGITSRYNSHLVVIHDQNLLPYKIKFHSNAYSLSNTNIKNNCQLSKPLIVFFGISKYDDGMDDLNCVTDDFENIVNTFNRKRGYSIAYFRKNCTLQIISGDAIHSHSAKRHAKHLKLEWDESNIFLFNSLVHRHICNVNKVKNVNKNVVHEAKSNDDVVGYDSLMYFVSSHGDTGGIIYDSRHEPLPLVTIFDQFNNKQCVYLRNKAKIYWISACRGTMRTKREKNSKFFESKTEEKDVSISNNINMNINDKVNITDNTHNNDIGIKTTSNDQVLDDKHDDDEFETKAEMNPVVNSGNANSLTSDDTTNEWQKPALKLKINTATTATKNKNNEKNNNNNSLSMLSNSNYNLHLFSKFNWNRVIYANADGYGVVAPYSKGEYMIRSVCQAFANNDIFQSDFDQIMVQIRRILTELMGTSPECGAQVIDDHNDIPCNIFFKYKTNNTSKKPQQK